MVIICKQIITCSCSIIRNRTKNSVYYIPEIFDLYRQWRENNERRSEDIINTYLQHSIDENALQKLGTESKSMKNF